MSKIVCKVDPFLYSQKVYIFDGEKITSTIEIDTPKLATDLVYFAYNKNIKDIELSGSKLYLSRFVKDMKNIANTDFENKYTLNIKIV